MNMFDTKKTLSLYVLYTMTVTMTNIYLK